MCSGNPLASNAKETAEFLSTSQVPALPQGTAASSSQPVRAHCADAEMAGLGVAAQQVSNTVVPLP